MERPSFVLVRELTGFHGDRYRPLTICTYTHYHAAQDTLRKLNYVVMSQVVQGLYKAIAPVAVE